MQHAEDIAPQQRTEQCPLEQYSFTAQQTVITLYTLGTVKWSKEGKAKHRGQNEPCLSYIVISDTVYLRNGRVE